MDKIKKLREDLEDFLPEKQIASFSKTSKSTTESGIPIYTNEFWTAKQRTASSLHEISYRACFKPLLPRFFIKRLTSHGDFVYDPFMGRGTAVLEGALLGRNVIGCDINPLSSVMLLPRLYPPKIEEVALRLNEIDLIYNEDIPQALLVFYHPETLRELLALRQYLTFKKMQNAFDLYDAWIEMVMLSRLTGHSKGFFSVYTLPPNQAVSIQSQQKINEKLNQTPPYRNVKDIIYNKSKTLLKTLSFDEETELYQYGKKAMLITGDCENTPQIGNESIDLIITSPPFLDTVDYKKDNWLRCTFAGIDMNTVNISLYRKADDWRDKMTAVFGEFRRVLKKDGLIAFEVGEIRKGTLKMEDLVLESAEKCGLNPVMIVINSQTFTKTSKCWGVDNNKCGTNSNRIIILT